MIRKLDGIKPGSFFYILGIVLIFTITKCLQLAFLTNTIIHPLDFAFIGFACISSFFQAIFFNRICIEYDVLYKHSYMPGAVFALLNVGNTVSFNWQIHLVLWLFLLVYLQVVSIDSSELTGVKIFNIAFLCTIISFFVPFFYFSPVLLLLLIMVYKIPSLKEVLAASTGFVVPIFIVFSINYLFNLHLNYSLTKKLVFERVNLHLLLTIWSLLVLVVFVWGSLKSIINYFKNNNLTRKMLRLTLYLLIFTILILMLNMRNYEEVFCLTIAPLSVGLVYAFFGSKLIFWRNLVFYLLLASSISIIFVI